MQFCLANSTHVEQTIQLFANAAPFVVVFVRRLLEAISQRIVRLAILSREFEIFSYLHFPLIFLVLVETHSGYIVGVVVVIWF